MAPNGASHHKAPSGDAAAGLVGGWESGVVGDCTTQVGGITPAMLHWVDYDDGESHLHDLSTLRVMLETSSTDCELLPDTVVEPRTL